MFFVVSSPSQAIFPGSQPKIICLNVLNFIFRSEKVNLLRKRETSDQKRETGPKRGLKEGDLTGLLTRSYFLGYFLCEHAAAKFTPQCSE